MNTEEGIEVSIHAPAGGATLHYDPHTNRH